MVCRSGWKGRTRCDQPQHPERAGAGLGGVDGLALQPQPKPPEVLTSASRAQQADAPSGAGPPQQAVGVDAVVVGDVSVAAVVDIRGLLSQGPHGSRPSV